MAFPATISVNVRAAALIEKVKGYTLDQLAAKSPGEMYYI